MNLRDFISFAKRSFLCGSSKVIPSTRTCTPPQSVSQYEEMEVDKAVAVTAMPIPTSPVKTRHISKCSSCKILRQSVLKLQQEKITAVKNLRAQQKKRESIKSLNQKIKRKELVFKSKIPVQILCTRQRSGSSKD